MTTPEIVRIPANPITPHGAYFFLKGTHPRLKLTAYDGSVEIKMMGGDSQADKFDAPECVMVNGPIKGIIAPWTMVDQQSANEDGVTFLDAVNEPVEIEIPVKVVARDGKHLRRTVDLLIGSIDKIRTAQLSWFTQDLGLWWADVRWFKTPPGGFSIGGQRRSIAFPLVLRGDHGFWRSFDHVAEYRFAYEQMVDNFDTDYTEARSLGPDWSVHLDGPGGGYPFAGRGKAQWRDDPDRLFFTQGKTFVATHKTFETVTDDQVVGVVLDTMSEIGGRFDLWARKGHRSDGSWDGYGVRARVGGGSVQLHAFNNFHATHLRTWVGVVPPLFGEKWWIEAGGLTPKGEYDPRVFRVKRGGGSGFTSLYHRDDTGITPFGAAFRGVGFGGYAAGALFTQGTPPAFRKVFAGDATATTQQGQLKMLNIGDQPAPPEYTLYGPGIFEIASAPGSSDMVKIGPLVPNQVVQVRTDNRRQRIVDLTRVPATAAELLEYREAMRDLESFAPIGNIGPTVESNASAFGVVPPQGNVNRLIDGWFTRPIPQKSPGRKPEPHLIAVSISGGNSDSRVVGTLTPLRRWPN